MGALNAALSTFPLVRPLPDPTPPPSRRNLRLEPRRHDGPDADASVIRYHIVKRSMTGRGDRRVVIYDCWGVKKLEQIWNLPPHLPWYNDVIGATIEIERWSQEKDAWELCNDPRGKR
jgi:hypothetical protein